MSLREAESDEGSLDDSEGNSPALDPHRLSGFFVIPSSVHPVPGRQPRAGTSSSVEQLPDKHEVRIRTIHTARDHDHDNIVGSGRWTLATNEERKSPIAYQHPPPSFWRRAQSSKSSKQPFAYQWCLDHFCHDGNQLDRLCNATIEAYQSSRQSLERKKILSKAEKLECEWCHPNRNKDEINHHCLHVAKSSTLVLLVSAGILLGMTCFILIALIPRFICCMKKSGSLYKAKHPKLWYRDICPRLRNGSGSAECERSSFSVVRKRGANSQQKKVTSCRVTVMPCDHNRPRSDQDRGRSPEMPIAGYMHGSEQSSLPFEVKWQAEKKAGSLGLRSKRTGGCS